MADESVFLPYKQLHPCNQDNCPFTKSEQQHIRITFKGTAFRFSDNGLHVTKENRQNMVHLFTYLGYMLTAKMIDYKL